MFADVRAHTPARTYHKQTNMHGGQPNQGLSITTYDLLVPKIERVSDGTRLHLAFQDTQAPTNTQTNLQPIRRK